MTKYTFCVRIRTIHSLLCLVNLRPQNRFFRLRQPNIPDRALFLKQRYAYRKNLQVIGHFVNFEIATNIIRLIDQCHTRMRGATLSQIYSPGSQQVRKPHILLCN